MILESVIMVHRALLPEQPKTNLIIFINALVCLLFLTLPLKLKKGIIKCSWIELPVKPNEVNFVPADQIWQI